jgi:uncharacterized repeat protein (TIGR02543 family)
MNHKRVHTVSSFLTLLVVLVLGVSGVMAPAQAAPMRATTITFTGEELLGKPTDTSITINIVPASTIEYHYLYGTAPGSYTWQTPNATATGGQPHEVVIGGLDPNAHYYYGMRYHLPGETDWVERTEHSFWTQRAKGSTFTFTIIADSHAMYNAQYRQTIQNVSNDHPDFLFDLGDTFMTDGMTSQSAVNNAYLAQRDPLYMDGIGHSAPIFLASGNHENEEGWNFDDTFSIALASVKARKLYYPTPIEDDFYSGNTDPLTALDPATYGDQYREDYYAWEWGDALFVVIDPFQYTVLNPYGSAAGEGGDDPATGDQWNWTLGAQQFNWFKETIQNSNAKYKFVFCHNMLGGITRPISGVSAGYVRGGAEAAAYFEWGGKNADGTAGFASHRNPADFGTTPIHQLMVENGVSAYFHGHDHQYVYEKRDGIVYQEVPSPSMTGSGFSGIYTLGTYADYQTIAMYPNSGHLRVTVTPDVATVEYVRSNQSGVSYTYTIEPNTPSVTYDLTMAVDPAGSGTTVPVVGAHTYDEGTVVDVTASPNSGYAFDHWSGACTGTGACQVTMNADRSVTAHFTATYDLTMAVDPVGGGTTNPAVGVHAYAENAVVNITATANPGYTFSSWSGACTGSGTCSVTMDADKTVTAHFAQATSVLGGVNGDGVVNSTDALIILSCDVGIDTSQFCPMNCGDVNGDGLLNSTDALIIVSYDVGLAVPLPVGEPGCPSSVTPCPGCTP